jgi:hypothetical protein
VLPKLDWNWIRAQVQPEEGIAFLLQKENSLDNQYPIRDWGVPAQMDDCGAIAI